MIIGFTCGAFDLLHAGHVIMLEKCHDYCDKLIVGLHSDPTIDRPSKNKPIQSIYERYIQLKSCSPVDHIIPYDTEKDLENILATETIHKRFLGDEYKYSVNTGEEICRKRNIEIVFLDRMHSYSSSELRQRIYESHQKLF